MEEVSTTNPEKEPEKIPSTDVPIQDNVQQVEDSNKNGNDTTENNNSKCNSIEPLIVKINKEKGWSRQEKISLAAIIISAFLFILTLAIFKNTFHAISISDSTLADSRKRDNVNSIRNQIADSLSNVQFERNRIKDSLSMDLTMQSLQTQERFLNANQKNFQIENEPYLQINAITYEISGVPNTINFKYVIQNMGNYPAETIYDFAEIMVDTMPPIFKKIYTSKFTNKAPNSTYLIKGEPLKMLIEMDKKVNENSILLLKNPRYSLYFTTSIIYKNLITKQKKEYQFQIKMESDNIGWTTIVNKNTPSYKQESFPTK